MGWWVSGSLLLVGDWLVPRLVPWLNKMSAPQGIPGSGRGSSGSVQTTWDIPELDAADKELSNLVEVKNSKGPFLEVCGHRCYGGHHLFLNEMEWNSMLMTPRILSSNPFRANGSTLQRRGEKFLSWRRQWRPTPILLPGKSQGWRSLVGCSP